MHPEPETLPEAAHLTVLLDEAIDILEVAPTDVVVDATLGGAGHFRKFLEKLDAKGTLIGIDADSDAIGRAQKVLASIEESSRPRSALVENNFRNLDSILESLEIPKINKSLFDLGWSGFQLTRGRGFSFQTDEPLQMTYGDPETQKTAADVVNGASEEELSDMLWVLGEEQFSRKIAAAIVAARKKEKISTTFQLVEVIKQGTPAFYHNRRLHPATKTFQALRIYVNDELGALREGLDAAVEHTVPGGRIAVISFHSIEDRIVKHLFRDAVDKELGTLVVKKPIIANATELLQNPRARSAKLRVFQKS